MQQFGNFFNSENCATIAVTLAHYYFIFVQAGLGWSWHSAWNCNISWRKKEKPFPVFLSTNPLKRRWAFRKRLVQLIHPKSLMDVSERVYASQQLKKYTCAPNWGRKKHWTCAHIQNFKDDLTTSDKTAQNDFHPALKLWQTVHGCFKLGSISTSIIITIVVIIVVVAALISWHEVVVEFFHLIRSSCCKCKSLTVGLVFGFAHSHIYTKTSHKPTSNITTRHLF